MIKEKYDMLLSDNEDDDAETESTQSESQEDELDSSEN